MNVNELTVEEQKHFEKLVADAQRNNTEAQQLALDAGKLLTVSGKRWKDYKDRGFFKRCWYKISGKQGALDRANQKDLTEMQKYAWVYLTKLQEQNLIQAQAIAVIRNNLKDIVDEVGEIHDMISTLVAKFDKRITKLEEITALHDWLLHVEVNDFITDVKNLRCIALLRLTFDYLSVLRREGIDYTAIEKRDDLKAAMKKFDIAPNEKVTVDGFISRLFDECQEIGYDNFREVLTLRVDQGEIDARYILDNVSGAGYNAVYRFELEMDAMKNMAKNLQKDDPREIMLKTVRAVLNNPATEYTMNELAVEILCGSLLAVEIYKEENGIEDGGASGASDGQPFSIEDLLGDHISVKSHAFLDTDPTDEEKINYIESFSPLFAVWGGFTDERRHYLKAVSELFGCSRCLDRVEFLTANPKRIDVQAIKTALSTVARQYAWFVDAMYLGNCNGANGQAKQAILQMGRVLGCKSNELSDFLDVVETLVVEKEPAALFQAIQKINRKTDAWKTVLDFNGISLKGAFDEIKRELQSFSNQSTIISLEIAQAMLSLVDCSYSFGDMNFLERSAYAIARSAVLSKFEEQKKKAENFENSADSARRKANKILALFGTEELNYSDTLMNIDADRVTSLSNENWGENMEAAFDKLERFVSQISDVLSLQCEQLSLYEQGKYHESAVENRKLNAQKREAENKKEEERKKSVTLSKGENTASIRLDFEKIRDLPFDHETIRKVVSDGKVWYVLAEELWTSTDGLSWNKENIPTCNRMKYVNSTLILWNDYESTYHYSTDGAPWNSAEFPNNSGNEDVFFAGGKWYLQRNMYVSYSYVKEGIIWNSNETDSCQSTRLYTALSLAPGGADRGRSAGWKALGKNSSLPEGKYIPDGALIGDGDKLIAASAYDYSYRDHKHITNKGAELVYWTEEHGWRRAAFPVHDFEDQFGRIDNEVKGRFLKTNYGMLFASDKGIFHSPDGESWERCNGDFSFYYSRDFLVIGNLIFVYGGGRTIAVSADGETFHEMLLEHRAESMAAINDTILLADASRDGGLFIGNLQLS